ncbi:MAG: aspartate aminotransferase family protein [bacterium]|nr:aspartate aminotransferase family protein [Bacteroidales bacterium]MDD7235821.1 aspartate aminotransferase family protein [bacterium]MDY2649992.1 aspartate aminotransferase family protein [Candidatus Egerieousia sp.]MDY5024834.1 aspartate aminotransferase family protein [Candidatus Egerieousia sp.]
MNLFDVYTLWDIEPVKASGTKVWDSNGIEYLDLYGGHAVISIGHCHPTYTSMLHAQLDKLGFYSNAVQNSLQRELAEELGNICGYPQYSLFLCNSGAEANENAMKAASFQTGRKRILAIGKAFHGRTSGAVEATDNPKIQAPFNRNSNITFIPINDIDALESNLKSRQYAAFIFEGIQGVAGIYEPSVEYLRRAEELCKETGTILIADEVQSGCGRTGDFFAHQKSGVKPQIITMAKGTGNGFPIGAVLLSGDIKAEKGMLGTTFGGNHLACTAAIAVMKVLRKENLLENARKMGDYLLNALRGNKAIKELRGRGLMIGIELQPEYEDLRNRLLFEEHIFTGGAGKRVIRLLPPLCISKEDCDRFIEAFNKLTK